MWFHLWNGRTRGRVRPTVLISNVQQRAMASGQPYLKSGVIARLKHALVFGKVPVWAFSLATVLLLLVVNQGPGLHFGMGRAGRSHAGRLVYAPKSGAGKKYIMSTCTRDQEVVSTQENFLPPEEFATLKQGLLAELEPKWNNKGAGATRCLYCIHLVFNVAGVPKLRTHPRLAIMYPFFERVRLPDATNFDINVVMVEASDKVDYLAYWPHLDTTLTQEMSGKATIAGVTVTRDWDYGFLSDTSNVLYMQLPEDMTRGTLRVWDPHVYTPKILGIKIPPLPTHNLTLKENMRVRFRGDAMHALDGFQSRDKSKPRISLVIKQYKLSPGDYPFAPEWVQLV